MDDICENCERVIDGLVYVTADDYLLCGECWDSAFEMAGGSC